MYYECFPKKQVKIPKQKHFKPWIKGELLKQRNKKENAFRNYISVPTVENHNLYKTVRNDFTREERKAHLEHNEHKLKNATSSREKWKILNHITKRKTRKQTEIKELNINQKMETDSEKISNQFNLFFSQIGPNLAKNIPVSPKNPLEYLDETCEKKFVFSLVSDVVLQKIIKKVMKKNKAPGIDEIFGEVILENADVLALPISYAINISLASGVFPEKLKTALITPIFKGEGKRNEESNFRPISLLPVISKLYEKAIAFQITTFLSENQILSDSQFGFRNGHNTAHAIMALLERLADSIEKGDYTVAVILDLKKAFDTVDHDILLMKLNHYGISDAALSLFRSYLSSRKQFVRVNDKFSEPRQMVCGVPQGSILGPLLFIVYINDLCSISKSVHSIIFADDSNFFKSGKDLASLSKEMEQEMIDVILWLNANKLSLNVIKTKTMAFCPHQKNENPQVKLQINDTEIEQVKTSKFLGVHLNEHLNWTEHISHVTKKVAQVSGMIYSSKSYLPKKSRLELYNTLALPHIMYCNPIWGASCPERLDPLIKCQKRIVRNITDSAFDAHSAPLFHSLDMLTVKDLNAVETLKIIHKHEYGSLPKSLQKPNMKNCDMHTHNTRHKNDFYLKKKKKRRTWRVTHQCCTEVVNFGMTCLRN